MTERTRVTRRGALQTLSLGTLGWATACASTEEVQREPVLVFDAAFSPVYNRGRPSTGFLEELLAWGRGADDAIFAVNDRYDVYSSIHGVLGPWSGLNHRKAAMLETLRVLGGFESSWDWQAGRDRSNPSSVAPCTMEAGIFQCSGDSMNFDRSLRLLLQRHSGGLADCDTFRETTRANHAFAIEYCARLLRFTTRHHGPILRREIHAWLRRDAVREFEGMLQG